MQRLGSVDLMVHHPRKIILRWAHKVEPRHSYLAGGWEWSCLRAQWRYPYTKLNFRSSTCGIWDTDHKCQNHRCINSRSLEVKRLILKIRVHKDRSSHCNDNNKTNALRPANFVACLACLINIECRKKRLHSKSSPVSQRIRSRLQNRRLVWDRSRLSFVNKDFAFEEPQLIYMNHNILWISYSFFIFEAYTVFYPRNTRNHKFWIRAPTLSTFKLWGGR